MKRLCYLAVGVSFGVEEIATDLSVAVAIGLQNIPKGFAIVTPLVRERYSRKMQHCWLFQKV